jgi:hypothetical protein
MGISTFTSKEFMFLQAIWQIGRLYSGGIAGDMGIWLKNWEYMQVSIVMRLPLKIAGWFISWKIPDLEVALWKASYNRKTIPGRLGSIAIKLRP